MEEIADKLLDLLAAFGLGIILFFGIGFWLFHRTKKDSERKSEPPEPRNTTKPSPTNHP